MWRRTTRPQVCGPGGTRRMCTGVLWVVHISQLQGRSLMIISRGLETSSKRSILRYILENVPQDSNRRRERGLPETGNGRAAQRGMPYSQCAWVGETREREGSREESCRGISMEGLQFPARGLSFILQAVSRDGWDCPSNTFKVTRLPLCPSASKARGMYSPSQGWCQRQRLLI